MVPLTPVSTIVTYTKTSITTRVDKVATQCCFVLVVWLLVTEEGGGQEIPQLCLRPCLTQDTSTPPKMAAPSFPCMSSPRGEAKVSPLLEVRDQLRSFGRQMLQMWAWGGGRRQAGQSSVRRQDSSDASVQRGLTFV